MHMTIFAMLIVVGSLVHQYEAKCTDEVIDFSKCQRAYQKSCVKAHNVYRRKHHAPPLTENSHLNQVAQDYAYYLAENNIFEHSDMDEFGENLAYSWSSKISSMDEDDCSCKPFLYSIF